MDSIVAFGKRRTQAKQAPSGTPGPGREGDRRPGKSLRAFERSLPREHRADARQLKEPAPRELAAIVPVAEACRQRPTNRLPDPGYITCPKDIDTFRPGWASMPVPGLAHEPEARALEQCDGTVVLGVDLRHAQALPAEGARPFLRRSRGSGHHRPRSAWCPGKGRRSRRGPRRRRHPLRSRQFADVGEIGIHAFDRCDSLPWTLRP